MEKLFRQTDRAENPEYERYLKLNLNGTMPQSIPAQNDLI